MPLFSFPFFIEALYLLAVTHKEVYKRRKRKTLKEGPNKFEDMAEKKRPFMVPLMLLMILWLMMVSPTMACAPDGSACKDCITNQMKYGCPNCVPILRCMARCLWAGTSRSKCISSCDCNGGKPTLSECKRCMSRCKCSCVA